MPERKEKPLRAQERISRKRLVPPGGGEREKRRRGRGGNKGRGEGGMRKEG